MVNRYGGIRNPAVRDAVRRYDAIRKKQKSSRRRSGGGGSSSSKPVEKKPEVEQPTEIKTPPKTSTPPKTEETTTTTTDFISGTTNPTVRRAIINRINERGETITSGAGRTYQMVQQKREEVKHDMVKAVLEKQRIKRAQDNKSLNPSVIYDTNKSLSKNLSIQKREQEKLAYWVSLEKERRKSGMSNIEAVQRRRYKAYEEEKFRVEQQNFKSKKEFQDKLDTLSDQSQYWTPEKTKGFRKENVQPEFKEQTFTVKTGLSFKERQDLERRKIIYNKAKNSNFVGKTLGGIVLSDTKSLKDRYKIYNNPVNTYAGAFEKASLLSKSDNSFFNKQTFFSKAFSKANEPIKFLGLSAGFITPLIERDVFNPISNRITNFLPKSPTQKEIFSDFGKFTPSSSGVKTIFTDQGKFSYFKQRNNKIKSSPLGIAETLSVGSGQYAYVRENPLTSATIFGTALVGGGVVGGITTSVAGSGLLAKGLGLLYVGRLAYNFYKAKDYYDLGYRTAPITLETAGFVSGLALGKPIITTRTSRLRTRVSRVSDGFNVRFDKGKVEVFSQPTYKKLLGFKSKTKISTLNLQGQGVITSFPNQPNRYLASYTGKLGKEKFRVFSEFYYKGGITEKSRVFFKGQEFNINSNFIGVGKRFKGFYDVSDKPSKFYSLLNDKKINWGSKIGGGFSETIVKNPKLFRSGGLTTFENINDLNLINNKLTFTIKKMFASKTASYSFGYGRVTGNINQASLRGYPISSGSKFIPKPQAQLGSGLITSDKTLARFIPQSVFSLNPVWKSGLLVVPFSSGLLPSLPQSRGLFSYTNQAGFIERQGVSSRESSLSDGYNINRAQADLNSLNEFNARNVFIENISNKTVNDVGSTSSFKSVAPPVSTFNLVPPPIIPTPVIPPLPPPIPWFPKLPDLFDEPKKKKKKKKKKFSKFKVRQKKYVPTFYSFAGNIRRPIKKVKNLTGLDIRPIPIKRFKL